MRAIKPEINEQANFYAWYVPRSTVEITIPGWPRRQRFGHLLWADPLNSQKTDLSRPWVCSTGGVALPKRFRMTQRSWDELDYFDMLTARGFEQSIPLRHEDMAKISDDEDLYRMYGGTLSGHEFRVIEPYVRPVQRVARLVRL